MIQQRHQRLEVITHWKCVSCEAKIRIAIGGEYLKLNDIALRYLTSRTHKQQSGSKIRRQDRTPVQGSISVQRFVQTEHYLVLDPIQSMADNDIANKEGYVRMLDS